MSKDRHPPAGPAKVVAPEPPAPAPPAPPAAPAPAINDAVLYTSPRTLEVQAAVITGLNVMDGTVALTVFPRTARGPAELTTPINAQVWSVGSAEFTTETPGTNAAAGRWARRS